MPTKLKDKELVEQKNTECRALIRTYFQAEDSTDLEKFIEKIYLIKKCKQSISLFKNIFKNYKMMLNFKQEEGNILKQNLLNFTQRDILQSDYSFLPLKRNIHSRIYDKNDFVRKMLCDIFNFEEFVLIQKDTFVFEEINKLIYSLIESIALYCESIEFNAAFDLPPDKLLNFIIIHLHVFLLHNGIRKFNDAKSTAFANNFETNFDIFLNIYFDKIEYKKKDYLKGDYEQRTFNRSAKYREFFNMDRSQNEDWKHKLLEIVYSDIFMHKVEKGDWRIPFMANYILQVEKVFDQTSFLDIIYDHFYISPLLVDADYQSYFESNNS